jgi:hypothetical protein
MVSVENAFHWSFFLAPGQIRTHYRSRRVAVDLRLRPRDHWGRQNMFTYKNSWISTATFYTRLHAVLQGHSVNINKQRSHYNDLSRWPLETASGIQCILPSANPKCLSTSTVEPRFTNLIRSWRPFVTRNIRKPKLYKKPQNTMKFKRRCGEFEQGCVLSEGYTATDALPPILPACRQPLLPACVFVTRDTVRHPRSFFVRKILL